MQATEKALGPPEETEQGPVLDERLTDSTAELKDPQKEVPSCSFVSFANPMVELLLDALFRGDLAVESLSMSEDCGYVITLKEVKS